MTAEHSRRNLVLAAIALIGLIALIAAVFIGYWGKRPRLTGSPAGSDDRQQKTQALPKPNTAELRAQAFKAIDAAATAGSLKPHLQSADPAVRSQAIRRLGEIGGEASVPLLAEAFQHEARRKGTDVDAGVHGEAIRAMARIRTAAARTELVRIINEWLQEGSKEQGLYAHILDTQHFAVLKVAIESLESFGDEETHSLLERIRDNASFFY
jgi:HEAT repeat protein